MRAVSAVNSECSQTMFMTRFSRSLSPGFGGRAISPFALQGVVLQTIMLHNVTQWRDLSTLKHCPRYTSWVWLAPYVELPLSGVAPGSGLKVLDSALSRRMWPSTSAANKARFNASVRHAADTPMSTASRTIERCSGLRRRCFMRISIGLKTGCRRSFSLCHGVKVAVRSRVGLTKAA